MSTRKFFIGFLKHRRLPEPDGRRLYEYRCEDDAYVCLSDILRESGDPQHLRMQHDGYGHFKAEAPNWEALDDADIMACFVLYASEWYRRWNPPPRRTWAQMLDGIFWHRTAYTELYPAIVYGLSRWKRPVIKMPGSIRYLDTIAYESDASITGLEMTEYRLVSPDDDNQRARYEAYGCYPGGLRPQTFEVRRHADKPAPKRMTGLFDTDPP